MLILAIDPGGTTGWATCTIDISKPQPLWREKIEDHFDDCGQLGPEEHHNTLDRLMLTKKPDLILCERFEHRNNEFSQLISVEYIGVVKRYCQRHKTRLKFQGASQALTWSSDRKLAYLNLWLKPGRTWRHALDARRHLLYYLVHDAGYHEMAVKILNNLRSTVE